MGEITYTFETIGGKDIIIRKLSGDITPDDVIDSFNYLLDGNKISDSCVGILTDARDAKFKFTIRKFSRIVHYLRKTKKIKTIKLAVLVDTPDKTIFPLLAARKIPLLKIKPFSTLESAYQWLLNC